MAQLRIIEVIVSSVKRRNQDEEIWMPISDGILRQVFTDPVEALRVAMSHRAPGICVIIRPNFNEEHIRRNPRDPSGYREWRSFGGGLFEEIHFFMTFGDEIVSMTRLDAELVMPPILAENKTTQEETIYGVRCSLGWVSFDSTLRKGGTRLEAEALRAEMGMENPSIEYVVGFYHPGS